MLQEILSDWKTRMSPGPDFIERRLPLPAALDPATALVIAGVRRAGKSTLLGHLPRRYGLPLERCFFCNFEDPDLALQLDHTLLDRVVAAAREQIGARGPAYFFLDEIQNVDAWEKWLHKALTGNRRDHFVLSGSNASLLSGELATALTGRHATVELFPFSWAELRGARRRFTLEDYLERGGFPQAVASADPAAFLKELFRDIIFRDVHPRLRARSAQGVLQVVVMACQSVGSELSLRRIAGACGLAVDTVGSYLQACEQAYLLFACPYFSYSARQQARRNCKYYLVDPALRAAASGTLERDKGKGLENLVYLQLRRQGREVCYWREDGEVDFVVREGRQVTPYMVSWEGEQSRHGRALERFYQRFPHAAEPVFVSAASATSFLSDGA